MRPSIGSVSSLFVVVWLGALCIDARASAIFDWVCDDPTCNGDPDFAASLEFSDAALAAGDFTGVSGNILSASVTSGVGDGFSLVLSDMLTGPPGSNEDDVNNIRIVLNAARTEVIELIDISAGTNITFARTGEGRVDFLETIEVSPYFVQFVQDQPPHWPVSSEYTRSFPATRSGAEQPRPSGGGRAGTRLGSAPPPVAGHPDGLANNAEFLGKRSGNRRFGRGQPPV